MTQPGWYDEFGGGRSSGLRTEDGGGARDQRQQDELRGVRNLALAVIREAIIDLHTGSLPARKAAKAFFASDFDLGFWCSLLGSEVSASTLRRDVLTGRVPRGRLPRTRKKLLEVTRKLEKDV